MILIIVFRLDGDSEENLAGFEWQGRGWQVHGCVSDSVVLQRAESQSRLARH